MPPRKFCEYDSGKQTVKTVPLNPKGKQARMPVASTILLNQARAWYLKITSVWMYASLRTQ